MFLRTVLLLWCCGLLGPRQMLRHQGLLKCRCRMLFNDLKVLLLRRPPQTPCLPMNSTECEGGAGGSLAANNNTLTSLGRAWRVPAGGTTTPEEEWCYPATAPGLQHQPMSMDSSNSSDEFCKGKAEDRYSLGSLDSGMRTPLCRICFQGPEQVSSAPCMCGVTLHRPMSVLNISCPARGCQYGSKS